MIGLRGIQGCGSSTEWDTGLWIRQLLVKGDPDPTHHLARDLDPSMLRLFDIATSNNFSNALLSGLSNFFCTDPARNLWISSVKDPNPLRQHWINLMGEGKYHFTPNKRKINGYSADFFFAKSKDQFQKLSPWDLFMYIYQSLLYCNSVSVNTEVRKDQPNVRVIFSAQRNRRKAYCAVLAANINGTAVKSFNEPPGKIPFLFVIWIVLFTAECRVYTNLL